MTLTSSAMMHGVSVLAPRAMLIALAIYMKGVYVAFSVGGLAAVLPLANM